MVVDTVLTCFASVFAINLCLPSLSLQMKTDPKGARSAVQCAQVHICDDVSVMQCTCSHHTHSQESVT